MRVAPLATNEPLPTVAEMKAKARDQIRSERQAFFERRFRCRQLLFGKGLGIQKNLSHQEDLFVREVAHETYQLYLQEFITGKSRYNVGKSWSRARRPGRRKNPLRFAEWRRKWWGSQKVRYVRHDIPMLFQKKMEDLRYGDRK